MGGWGCTGPAVRWILCTLAWEEPSLMKEIIKRLMYENRNQLIGYALLGLALGWYIGS